MNNSLPDWLVAYFRIALLGEIYPQVRGVAVSYNESKELLIRYYLDRVPTYFDEESIEVVATNLDAVVPKGKIVKMHLECIFSVELQRDFDVLSGLIYARREYDLDVVR